LGEGVDAWFLPHPYPIPAGMVTDTVLLLNGVPCFLVEPVSILVEVKVPN
jgi:hypothetical protein